MKKIYRVFSNNIFILKYAFKYGKFTLIFRFIIIIFEVMVTYLGLNITKWVFDGINSGKAINDIFIIIISIGLFSAINNLFTGWYHILLAPIIKINITSKITKDVIHKIKKIDQINFENKSFYDKYSRGIKEIDGRLEKVINNLYNSITAIIQTFVIAAITINLNKYITIFSICCVLLGMFINQRNNKLSYNENFENTTNKRKLEYIKRIIYIPEFSKDIKLYKDYENFLSNRYQEESKKVINIFKKYAIKKYIINNILSLINIAFMSVLPWIATVISLYNNSISMGEATVLMSSATVLPSKLRTISSFYNNLYNDSLYIENLRTVLEYETKIDNGTGNKLNLSNIKIQMRNVGFSYNKDKKILEQINIDINSGEKIALVGYNGAGKSTLTKLLVRLYDVDNGSISLNEVNYKNIDVEDIRKNIIVLSQDFKIYSFSIAENILMRAPKCPDDYTLVDDALKKVSLYDFVYSHEKNINSYITNEFDSEGIYFSGGQLQKLALARLYASNAECIILDEPTSALDPISENEIIKTMYEVFINKTMIIISHRLSIVKDVDRIYYLHNNKIIEEGSHEELMKKNGEYYKLYTTQAEKYRL